jgi:hypothetical protein
MDVHMAHEPHHHHAVTAEPGFSLLRLSVGERLGWAALVIIALWAAVLWAL